jgi:Na+/proline symporter
VIAFVLWSGLHGVARTSYFKDSLMLVITFAVPMHLNGGLDFGLSTIARDMPRLLYVQPGSYGIWWFITSMAISTIGTIFYSSSMSWPAVMASRNERAVRRNLTFSGSAQVIPAIAGTLLLKRQLDRASVIAGLCAGSIIVIVFTFWPLSGLDINAGISGLAVNIAVIAVVEFLVRERRAALPARMRSEAAVRS